MGALGKCVNRLVLLSPQSKDAWRMPTGIDMLAPTDRFVRAMNTIPITPGIPFHQIMGDRSRGDTPIAAMASFPTAVLILRERSRSSSCPRATPPMRIRRRSKKCCAFSS
jgi:hypothetical protein